MFHREYEQLSFLVNRHLEVSLLNLIDISKRVENELLKEDIKENVYPINASLYKIPVGNIVSNFIYLESDGEIVGKVETDLIAYLQISDKEDLLKNIVENIEEGIVAIDENGRIYYTNSSYSKILGVALRNVIGKYMQDIESEAIVLEALRTKRQIKKKNQYIKNLNKYVNVKIYPIFKEDIFKGVFSIFNDTTEINNLNEKLTRMANVAREYNERITAREKLKELKIIGKDPEYLRVVEKALTVSTTDVGILILGENGTGKDVLSRLIFENSKRNNEPFIVLNCAAIPESLIESEMFGYEPGAFTGAKKAGKMGKFQLADKGTIFLDEIGDMSLEMQAKLLRTLETGEIEKVGSEEKLKVDVRVIAATNRNLEEKIREGTFREDLYFRLSVVTIEIPPLRKRGIDVVLFLEHFLKSYNIKYGKKLSMSEEVIKILVEYTWPGNIRELKNCMEQCVILTHGELIEYEDLPKRIRESNYSKEVRTLDELLSKQEFKIIIDALEVSDWDVKKASELLCISERTLYRRMKKHNIKLS